jgi:hypothetical protein
MISGDSVTPAKSILTKLTCSALSDLRGAGTCAGAACRRRVATWRADGCASFGRNVTRRGRMIIHHRHYASICASAASVSGSQKVSSIPRNISIAIDSSARACWLCPLASALESQTPWSTRRPLVSLLQWGWGRAVRRTSTPARTPRRCRGWPPSERDGATRRRWADSAGEPPETLDGKTRA